MGQGPSRSYFLKSHSSGLNMVSVEPADAVAGCVLFTNLTDLHGSYQCFFLWKQLLSMSVCVSLSLLCVALDVATADI